MPTNTDSGNYAPLKTFQIKAENGYTRRVLIPSNKYSFFAHLPETDFTLSAATKKAVAFSTDVFLITDIQAAEYSKLYNVETKAYYEAKRKHEADPANNPKPAENVKLHEMLYNALVPVAPNIVFDFDGENHTLTQNVLESARRLNAFLSDELGMVCGHNFSIDYTGCGGFHFVIPYWAYDGKFETHNPDRARTYAEHLAYSAGVLDSIDKTVYNTGQIFKAAFSHNTRSKSNYGFDLFSYPLTSHELNTLSIEELIERGKNPRYIEPDEPQKLVVTKLRNLIQEVKVKTFIPPTPPAVIVPSYSRQKRTSRQPKICPVIENIFKIGRDALAERWKSGGSRWNEQLKIWPVAYILGIEDYYFEQLESIFGVDRVANWRKESNAADKTPNCISLQKFNEELTGVVRRCNNKCELYPNLIKFSTSSGDFDNAKKSSPAIYNSYARRYFEEKKIYIHDQDLYEVKDNKAFALDNKRIEKIQQDFKIFLTDEFSDPAIISKMMSYNFCIPNLCDDRNMIPFKNGILNVNKLLTDPQNALEPYNDRVVFYQLPYDFSTSEEGEYFDCYIAGTLMPQAEGDIEIEKLGHFIDEYLATIAFGRQINRSTGIAYLLRGITGSGKSGLLESSRAMVGKENCGHTSLHDITDDEDIYFNRFMRANISDESAKREKYSDEAKLKKIIDGDTLTIKRKYKLATSITPNWINVWAANSGTFFGDRSSVAARIVVIPFIKSFRFTEFDDDKLYDKIIDNDLPYLWYRAVRGLKRLKKNNEYTLPKFIIRAGKSEFGNNSPVYDWAEQNLVWEKGGFLRGIDETGYSSPNSTTTAYESFKEFCNRTGVGGKWSYKGFINDFTEHVMNGKMKLEPTHSNGNVFRNIRLRVHSNGKDLNLPSIFDLTYDEYLKSLSTPQNDVKAQGQILPMLPITQPVVSVDKAAVVKSFNNFVMNSSRELKQNIYSNINFFLDLDEDISVEKYPDFFRRHVEQMPLDEKTLSNIKRCCDLEPIPKEALS